jgi:predicted AAA+ superfamily ATPase
VLNEWSYWDKPPPSSVPRSPTRFPLVVPPDLKTAHPTNVRYIVTGSNAALLSGDLSTALTGRHLTVEFFPFAYEEFQVVRQGNLESHLSIGGFPRALTFTPPTQLLREYFADIVEKDVRRHVAVRDNLNLGRNFENMVYLMLRRHTRRIFFWRGKGEVDFVVPTAEGIQPIQVSYEGTKARHQKAIEEFQRTYPDAREPLFVTPQTLAEFGEWIESADFP